MTLRARLWLGFAAICLLLAAPLALALQALGDAERAAEELRKEEVRESLLLTRVRSTVEGLRRGDLGMSARLGDTLQHVFMQEQLDSLRRLGDELEGTKLKTLRLAVGRSSISLDRYVPEIWANSVAQRGPTVDSLSEAYVTPAIRAIEVAASTAESDVSTRARERTDDVQQGAANARTLAGWLVIAAGVGVLAIAIGLTRYVGRPLEALDRGMAAVAAGDFGHRLAVGPGRRDEFGRVSGSFRQMADRLAELDRLKAEFVSVASHELKTPINVILGYLTLLQDGLYGDVPGPQREVLGTIETQARSLGRLVQHLLDVSRFQASGGRLELRPSALHAFLAETERSFRVLAVQRNVGFAILPTGALPEVVTWDRDRMAEVLGNLLSNAFKFTAAGGRVEVHVTALPPEPGSDARVHLEVRDTGVGIAPTELPHIFGKFYQADNQRAAGATGTGLGLAIVKDIVEAHGGTITVDSTLGVGSRFSLVVPQHARPRAGDVLRSRHSGRHTAVNLRAVAATTGERPRSGGSA